MDMIQLTEKKWEVLHLRLVQDYRNEPSVMLIRGKMQRVLGCTVRHHTDFVKEHDPARSHWVWPRKSIYLDFYNDALETFFKLKYAEYL